MAHWQGRSHITGGAGVARRFTIRWRDRARAWDNGVIADRTEPSRLGRGPLWLLLALLGLGAVLAHVLGPERGPQSGSESGPEHGYQGRPERGRTGGGLPHGDGLYHYAQVRSLVLDRDLRLANDYARLGNPHGQPVRDDGWAGSHFTMGTALTWVPSFVVAHGVTVIGNALGWWDEPGDGTSARCQRITMLGSVLSGWLALVLIARLWLRWLDVRAVALCVVLCALATPLWWYVTRQPSWSHAASAFAVAGLCHATASGVAGIRRGAIVGLWLGLVALVRPQDVVFAVWPVGQGLAALRDPARRGAGGQGLVAMVVVAGLCWLPQAWVWHQAQGTAWQIPQGPSFMRWDHSQWDLVLWSSRGGLLSWSPAVGMALVGLAMAAIRGPMRWPARALAVSLMLEIYVCGAVDDWWGGWAFGARRLVSATVVFGLGWATLLQWGLGHRRAGLGARVLMAALVLGSVRLSQQLHDDVLRGRLRRGVPQSLAPAWTRAFGVPLDAVLERTGTPGSWPASWVFGARTGAPPGRYDLATGWALVRARGDGKGYERLWIDDPRWALAGLGPVHARGEHRARTVEGIATLGVPLRAPLRLRARLRAWTEVGCTVVVELPTARIELSLRPGWHDYALEGPGASAHAWPAGLGLVRVHGPSDAPNDDASVELSWLDVFLPGHDPQLHPPASDAR